MTSELDGVPVSADQIMGLALYGYGHFTSLRVTGSAARGLALHLARLADDSRQLFDWELDTEHVRTLVRRACGERDVVVRATVYAPDLDLGLPGRPLSPRVLVTTRPASVHDLPPLRLSSSRYQRDLPTIKHVGLFGTVARRRSAQLRGFDDVVFTDDVGRLTEGATWNVGFIDDAGGVVWPTGECLPGVTMRLLQTEIPFTTNHVGLNAARGMRAAFVTNAAIGVRPISSIDDIEYDVTDGSITKLRRAYEDIAAEDL